ncbi:hypothetical protein I317_05477 [Kwoniella heveanensis CBS 569]|uniref:Uncharacterized protein n=1 Tax=Kwoniella heveanensis BCC8398 TaxID=1296120 RepID=A0A1B9GP94_9TREE|nr:hypothetical protein I316_05556 [Kwoniella heveanensis BCC8398]OCF40705.1 hypothetical protein I317_05477 [Kwoniella heveanensis CBS 569]
MFVNFFLTLALLAGTSVLANTPPAAGASKRDEAIAPAAGGVDGADVSINPRAGTGPLRLLTQPYSTCESNGPGAVIWKTHDRDQHNLDFTPEWKEEHFMMLLYGWENGKLILLITLLGRLLP